MSRLDGEAGAGTVCCGGRARCPDTACGRNSASSMCPWRSIVRVRTCHSRSGRSYEPLAVLTSLKVYAWISSWSIFTASHGVSQKWYSPYSPLRGSKTLRLYPAGLPQTSHECMLHSSVDETEGEADDDSHPKCRCDVHLWQLVASDPQFHLNSPGMFHSRLLNEHLHTQDSGAFP